MFAIKLVYQEVEKNNDQMVTKVLNVREECFSCDRYLLFQDGFCEKKVSQDEEEVPQMKLIVEVIKNNGGWDRTINFPSEHPTQVITIFIMNEDGKTIDKYIY